MQTTRTLSLALVLGLAFPWAASASLEVTPPEIEVEQHELKNGLTVLLHEDHSVPLVNLQVWYYVGSKNERPGRSGFAHMFEHLMFKGSDNVGPEEHKSYIQSVGGRYNATTDFDRTLYWETFPSNYLERILWMEADRMSSLHVSDENFQSEREVVKEERRVRVDNPPFGRIAEVVLDATWSAHPYRINAIGSMADLDAATPEDVREFYRVYYLPRNATLVVSGDFDSKKVMKWVRKHFGDIPKGDPISRDIPQEPAQTASTRVTDYHSNTPLPAVILTYHVPQAGHPDQYPLEVAGNILSAGQSSRLYRKLVYDTQIALQAAGQALVLDDPGVFFFFAIMNAGNATEDGEAALLEEVERLKSEPVSEDELAKAKNQFISQLVFGRQTVQQKANAIGYAAVILGDVELVNQQLAEYQLVTAADIQRVAKKYFNETNLTTVLMLPEAMRPADETAAEEGR